jgi:hypothetical protein
MMMLLPAPSQRRRPQRPAIDGGVHDHRYMPSLLDLPAVGIG